MRVPGRLVALVAALSALTLAPVVVAGWDFSQYLGAGALTIDGSTTATTLSANYSDFDTSFGAGPDSGAFGTMYIDGSNGSSSTTDFAPTSMSLASNITGPQNGVPAGDVPFDSFTVLSAQGQTFTNALSMIAQASSMVVFEADATGSAPAKSAIFTLTFAGQTVSGTSDVDIEFRAGNGGYTFVDTVTIDNTDTQFDVPLGRVFANQPVFVRLSFAPSGVDQPRVDNLMIGYEVSSAVPSRSPIGGALLMSLVALAGGVGIHRFRRGCAAASEPPRPRRGQQGQASRARRGPPRGGPGGRGRSGALQRSGRSATERSRGSS